MWNSYDLVTNLESVRVAYCLSEIGKLLKCKFLRTFLGVYGRIETHVEMYNFIIGNFRVMKGIESHLVLYAVYTAEKALKAVAAGVDRLGVPKD